MHFLWSWRATLNSVFETVDKDEAYWADLARLGLDQLPRAADASDRMLMMTVVLSIFIGLFLSALAWFGKQRWLLFWSAGLVVVSLLYGAAMVFDWA